MCPSGLNATEQTPLVWPVRVPSRLGWWGSLTSHNRAVLSTLAVARVCPSGLNATELDDVGVAGEGAQRAGMVGVADIPQPRGVVGAGGGQGVPVGAERHRRRRRWCGR